MKTKKIFNSGKRIFTLNNGCGNVVKLSPGKYSEVSVDKAISMCKSYPREVVTMDEGKKEKQNENSTKEQKINTEKNVNYNRK